MLSEINSEEGRALTVLEVAARAGVGEKAVLGWIGRGLRRGGRRVRLGAYRFGHQWRVPPDALEEFLRLCNPEPWAAAALKQECQRREAVRDSDQARRERNQRRRKRQPECRSSRLGGAS